MPYFPSCGGTPEADPSAALLRLLSAPPPTFYANLKSQQRRTYVAARAQLWMAPAMLFFQKRRMPYYLVEVNAGAGLNLAADVISGARGFRSELIDARVGLEATPLIIEDIAHRRWLTAGVYPDNLAAITELDKAIDAVAAANKEDASFIQLAPCAPEKAPAFIAKNIPAEEEAGLLAFNMGTTVRMADAEYAAYAKSMAATLAKWGDRGLWVEVESVRGETYSSTFQLRAHRVMGGQLRSMVLATLDMDAGTHAYSDASETFLATDPASK